MAVLEAIYDEGSTSRAGEVLFLNQSAVSHALKRLRDIYKDPLFTRKGHKMLPTPMTERIITRVKSGLRDIRRSIEEAHDFNPIEHRQRFHLGMRDTLEAGLFPPLMSNLTDLAPLININSRIVTPQTIEHELSIGKLDVCLDILTPVASHINHTCLCKDRLVIIGRQDHPAIQKHCSLDDFLSYRQILITVLEHEPEIMDHALAARGLKRNVVLRCQNTLSAIQVLLSSDYLSITPYSYAQLMSQYMPIKFVEVPFDLQQLEVHLYWHERHNCDPAHTWLRQQIVIAMDKISTLNTSPNAFEWIKRD